MKKLCFFCIFLALIGCNAEPKKYVGGICQYEKGQWVSLEGGDGHLTTLENLLSRKYYSLDFREGLLCVKADGKEGKWGYMNEKGDFVIQPEFDFAEGFDNGHARVKKGGAWIVIDKTGQVTQLPASANAVEDEQQAYCRYMKNKWDTDCKAFRKVHYPSAKSRFIMAGCPINGLGCSRYMYYYDRTCKGQIKTITYDEVWTQREKGEKSEVYWNNGHFLYEAGYVPTFRGFTVEHAAGKAINIKEQTGMEHAWFDCEVKK